MKLRLLFALLLLLLPSSAGAQTTIAFAPLKPIPGTFCQITLTGTATTLASGCTAGLPTTATSITVTVEAANARYRDDGTAPSATVGMLLTVGSYLSYSSDLTKIQFVAVSGSPVCPGRVLSR